MTSEHTPTPQTMLAALEAAGFTRYVTSPRHVGMSWPRGCGVQRHVAVPTDPTSGDYTAEMQRLRTVLHEAATAGAAARHALYVLTPPECTP